MKYIPLLLLIFISGCLSKEKGNSVTSKVQPYDKHINLEADRLQARTPDDFADLKEKDESCETTEDLEKKIEQQTREKVAFKLQGGDEGCSAD